MAHHTLRRPSNPTQSRQRGIALVITLVMLIVLLMLGLSSGQNAGLQERMAGATRNRAVAFEAAEALISKIGSGLARDRFASTSYLNTTFDGSGNVTAITTTTLSDHADNATYWNKALSFTTTIPTCSAASTSACIGTDLTSTDLNVVSPPRYALERLPDISGGQRYRITTRAVGGTNNAAVILQAIYYIP